MIAFLLALAPFLPAIMGIVGAVMSAFGGTAAQLQTYQDMVNAQNEMGNLSVQDHDALLGHIAVIKVRQAAQAAAAAKSDQSPPALPPA